MSPLIWYWHRLRAMGPAEIAAHVRKKIYHWQDARRLPDWASVNLASAASRLFPALPKPEAAPGVLREALASDTKEILAGRWKAFGHLEIQVDDPPQWHKDYLVGKNLATTESAFKLDHRELPSGADIKLIWELSRWHPLTRLAMAGYVLGDERADLKCVEWLADWVQRNPPYRGWNWTSALEAGMRLVQFTWIDSLLNGFVELNRPLTALETGIGNLLPEAKSSPKEGQVLASAGVIEVERLLKRLRGEILPAHVWFAWRYRSFGSSANNHLIGELAGLILAVARWPGLSRWATSLDRLRQLWEREVLAQFAEDGGNKEQALNYHLFSWEFCWQARAALVAAGHTISSDVEERLMRAASFFWEVQARRDPWDYGDSDNAFLSPFFVREKSALIEWRDWLSRSTTNAGAALDYWIGDPPQFLPQLSHGKPSHTIQSNDWWVYPRSGMGVCESGCWWLRWDLSPLGYRKTAAHGHLDALHLSIWFNGVAIVVDPGTGAYYADPNLRTWLASRDAHNGPSPMFWSRPVRQGSFLWSEEHDTPRWSRAGESGLTADWRLAAGSMRRRIIRLGTQDGWQVEDSLLSSTGSADFGVRWQFPPGAYLKLLSERRVLVNRGNVSVTVELGSEWTEVLVAEQRDQELLRSAAMNELEGQFAGTVSPAFRRMEWAPFLKLVARPQPGKPCVFRTTFLACRGP
jgi:hypothetical protein